MSREELIARKGEVQARIAQARSRLERAREEAERASPKAFGRLRRRWLAGRVAQLESQLDALMADEASLRQLIDRTRP